MNRLVIVEWVLRVAVALEFTGHGLIALGVHPPWLSFFVAVGLDVPFGVRWMPIVGAWDSVLALLVIIYPLRVLVLWMALWGLWTAMLRPISGQSVLELIERGPNWGAPLALLLLRPLPRSLRDWFSWGSPVERSAPGA